MNPSLNRIAILFLKTLAAVILISGALLFVTCASVEMVHNREARRLLRELAKVPLPEGAKLEKEGWEVSNYAGTGSACDAMAYRVFTVNLTAEEIIRRYPELVGGQASDEGGHGFFDLNEPPGPRVYVAESALREKLAAENHKPTFVVYHYERVGDGSWDLRGW